MPFLFIFVLFGTQTFSSCLVKLLYSCLSGCVICFALLYVSYVLLHRNQFFVCVCESVCVLAHLWPQMHVNVTQFPLASFDLSLFPWQLKRAPAPQLTEADNMKWV